MIVNPLMISLNSWSRKDFKSLCPICRNELTLNNECCYECQLNLRPRQIKDDFQVEEYDKKVKIYVNNKLQLTKN